MTRIEELSLKLADESLSEVDALELEGLLAKNRRAREIHIKILDLEARLRAKRNNPDLAVRIMARLRHRIAESIARDVMAKIRTQPTPERMPLGGGVGGEGKRTTDKKAERNSSKSPFSLGALL